MQLSEMEFIFSVIISTLITFPLCSTQICTCNDPPPCNHPTGDSPPCDSPPCDCGQPPRCKRDIHPFVYPHPGNWYKDYESGKYYYHLGNTVYVERSDTYYTMWVTSGDGADWVMNDNYIWQWDLNGRWYPLKEEDKNDDPNSCSRFRIPIQCLASECPKQARFPSNGKWWFISEGKTMFEQSYGDVRYEEQSNKMFHKFKGDVQVCPDNWVWDLLTGLWHPYKDETRTSCVADDHQENNEIGPRGEREGVFDPPRKMFDH